MSVPKIAVFASGSVAGAMIDYLATLAISNYLAVSPVVSLAISMIISASAVFLFHEFITFSPPPHSRRRRYLAFMSLAAIIFAIRSGVLQLLIWTGVPVWLALLLAIGSASAVNFLTSKKIIFR